MIPEFVRGPIAPVFTAFNEDQTLDDAGQRAFIDFLLESGAVSACFFRSGMGQMYTFSFEDVKQLGQNAVKHIDGRVPMLLGTGGIWNRDRNKLPDPKEYIRQAVELSKFAEGIGVDGVVHTMPEGLAGMDGKAPEAICLEYFETINDAVSIPIFIYQPPGTAEPFCVTPELIRKIAALENVVAIKISSSDVPYLFDIAYGTRDMDFGLIAGAEYVFYSALGFGAKACIGQGCTLNPQIIAAVQDRFEAGDFEGAMAAQKSVNILARGIRTCQEFTKRLAAEKGYKVKPYSRGGDVKVYGPTDLSISDEQYAAYKKLYATEVAKFEGAAAARS